MQSVQMCIVVCKFDRNFDDGAPWSIFKFIRLSICKAIFDSNPKEVREKYALTLSYESFSVWKFETLTRHSSAREEVRRLILAYMLKIESSNLKLTSIRVFVQNIWFLIIMEKIEKSWIIVQCNVDHPLTIYFIAIKKTLFIN